MPKARNFVREIGSGENQVDITVPAGRRWMVTAISYKLVTSANAGIRTMIVELFEPGAGSPALVIESPITTIENLTAFGVLGNGLPTDSSKQGQYYTVALPQFTMRPGGKITIRDSADIDDADDVLSVGVSGDSERGD